MLKSKLRELSSREERSRMYAEVAQGEAADEEKDSPDEFVELQVDFRQMERQLRTMKLWIYALGTLLLVTLVGLLLFLKSGAVISGGGNPSPVPEMPMTTVTFRKEEVFANNTAPGSDLAWAGLMPKGDGFVVVDNPEQYALQPGKNTTEGQLYDITMFHQLHCLKHIRVYLYSILDLSTTAIQGNNTEAVEQFLRKPDEHVHHCFDYIRQGIMCNADMTVEWPRVEPNGARFAVDGWGIEHQCKSWDAIQTWMEEKRFHHPWEKNEPWP